MNKTHNTFLTILLWFLVGFTVTLLVIEHYPPKKDVNINVEWRK